MAYKGQKQTRAIRRGPNRGKVTQMVSIKKPNGAIKNSYRARIPESQRKR